MNETQTQASIRDGHALRVAGELGLAPSQVAAAASLLAEGCTVPFIARYRKEATGSLDEVAVSRIRDRMRALEELDRRRQAILKSLQERGLLTEALKKKVEEAVSLTALEDVYLPYRPKRRTRATMAKEKGLEPLARDLFAQTGLDPAVAAAGFVDPEKGVSSVEEALSGARDMIAEWVCEDPEARAAVRRLFQDEGLFVTRVIEGKEKEGSKFADYFDWREPVAKAPSHRVLAMRRGEKEGFLTLRVEPPVEKVVELLESLFLRGEGADAEQVKAAIHDGYSRLLAPAMETEVRMLTKREADAEAIRVFAENLRQLLLAPPLGQKRILAMDPGFRTGCKVVCLDAQGKLLHAETVYPLLSQRDQEKAGERVRELCRRYEIEAIAVGNGTGGRETERFVRGLGLSHEILIVQVNESGASVYSASREAREEFPEHDVTVRGAVSIGRRLMDPLAELVKIDPKSIGVGQYQHDVDQKALRTALDDVVVSCVNAVGVEVNTASYQLLSYVSGLGPVLARNIVSHRDANGPFLSRASLLDVPRLGAKAFEQCAGFLRIRDGVHPLDASAVHPESYPVVEAMAQDLGCTIGDLLENPGLRARIRKEDYVTDKVGMPTLEDILAELARPGRDPRETFEAFSFAEGVESLEDLEPGMRLPGIVTNVTRFGAFVDVGVHQDGLVHVSELADHFVKDPSDVVQVHQKVTVHVLDVDVERKRISLSMRAEGAAGRKGEGGKRRGGQRSRKKTVPEKGRKAPFNNPFAEMLGPKGSRG